MTGCRQSSRGNDQTMDETSEAAVARENFHRALVVSFQTRRGVGDVEAAAAHFCQALRKLGVPPERMLIDAKAVIHAAIDGDDASLAEKAVTSCIQHYFRP
ncbi:MAG: hypothetical protein ABJA80_05825 [bacterium]